MATLNTVQTGRRFKSNSGPPTMQLAIMAVLEDSPMPWTTGMLVGYLGRSAACCATYAAENMRIWRIEKGLYAANKHRCPVVVADDWDESELDGVF